MKNLNKKYKKEKKINIQMKNKILLKINLIMINQTQVLKNKIKNIYKIILPLKSFKIVQISKFKNQLDKKLIF